MRNAKDMTMETPAILGITRISTLMFGVVMFAYKVSPTTAREKMIDLQATVRDVAGYDRVLSWMCRGRIGFSDTRND
jgi:hypothetical protein